MKIFKLLLLLLGVTFLTNCSKDKPINNSKFYTAQLQKKSTADIYLNQEDDFQTKNCDIIFTESQAIIEPNLRSLHDKYSLMAYDSILYWNNMRELDDSKINRMWNLNQVVIGIILI